MHKSSQLILVIEDNDGDLFLIREALQESGLAGSLLIARTGDEAIDLCREFDDDPGRQLPDLILLDLNLPRRHGLEVLGEIRESMRCCSIPVVILSTSDAPSEKRKAQDLGARGFLKKPSNLDDFLSLGSKLQEYLEQRTA